MTKFMSKFLEDYEHDISCLIEDGILDLADPEDLANFIIRLLNEARYIPEPYDAESVVVNCLELLEADK